MSDCKTHVPRPVPTSKKTSSKSILSEDKKAPLPRKHQAVRSLPSREVVMKLIAWFEQAQ
jgi:hypothetical protein